MSKFGLNVNTINLIQDCLKKYDNLEKVIIFGSRADGTYKHSSDIDLALIGEKIDFAFISRLAAALDELPTPYMFDLIDFMSITNEKLKSNILDYGQIFYECVNKCNE